MMLSSSPAQVNLRFFEVPNKLVVKSLEFLDWYMLKVSGGHLFPSLLMSDYVLQRATLTYCELSHTPAAAGQEKKKGNYD